MHDSRASGSTPAIDNRIAALAGRQHGVLSRAQLEAMIGRGSIAHRVQSGRLHRIHPGVYAVGHPLLSLNGKYMAATLAAGDGAVLSHRSAAELHGLLKTAAAKITVTSARRRQPSRALEVQAFTRSELEAAFLALVDAAGLPRRGRTRTSAVTRSTPTGPTTASSSSSTRSSTTGRERASNRTAARHRAPGRRPAHRPLHRPPHRA